MKAWNILGSDVMVGVRNRLHHRMIHAAGGRERPAFFSVDELCPALNRLRDEFPTIRRELLGVLDRKHLPTYHEFDPLQTDISKSDDGKRWRVFVLSFFGESPAHARDCPRTLELLAGVPFVWNAFFSVLDPGKNIPAHQGPWAGCLRYHLGLVVPKEAPPRIRVKDRWYTWAEGDHVLFDDSLEHQVENQATEPRAVLIVDVQRPKGAWRKNARPMDAVNRGVHHLLHRYAAKNIAAHADRTTPPLFD